MRCLRWTLWVAALAATAGHAGCTVDQSGLGAPRDGAPADAGADGEVDPPDGCAPSEEACNGSDDDCDGAVDEAFDPDTDPSHCGACGRACPADPANAAPVCSGGECGLRCDEGFGDCDGMVSNGCEASLGDAATCGSCTTSCSDPTPVCEGNPSDGWSCTDSCSSGETLCDTSCVDTDTSVSHCGGCNDVCSGGENATPVCESGSCEIDCDSGFGDCDGVVASGCEADLGSDATCGSCDNPCGGGETCSGASCVPDISISDVDYTVIAHGGALTVMGSGFSGASSVDIGGTSQTFSVPGDSTITIDAVPDSTPTGSQTLTVSGGGGSDTISVTVIHLVVNEVDVETDSGSDDEQLAEVSTSGEAGVALDGYTLVLFTGWSDESYRSEELLVTADSNGFVVVGSSDVSPDITIPDEEMEDGPAAVAIYQGSGGDYPDGTSVTEDALIDAVVYSRHDLPDDDGLLDVLMRGGGARVQIEGDPRDGSFSRCGSELRDGRAWETDRSPSASNTNDCP